MAAPNHMRPIASMSPGDAVKFAGKTSGKKDAEIGALCLWHEISVDNKPHCFSDLFEITKPKPFYLNSDLAKPGDSGAWIISLVNHVASWDGMLIGGDGAQAYCCFAENLLAEGRNCFRNDLSL